MGGGIAANAQAGDWTYQFGYQGGTTSAAYFGTKGVPSGLNNPGAREGSVTWTDSSGNLWFFGGYGDSSTYIGYTNDIWMWNTTTKVFTWEGGPATVNAPYYANAGVYGTQGTASATNSPGGRVAAQKWIDANDKVWMYGGQGADSTGNVGQLSDLWRYDPSTQLWTWIGGSTTIPGLGEGNPAVYGTQGVAAAGNTPGSRDAATTWMDASGNFWLFGGQNVSVFNDLWMYSPTSGLWTWVGGSNTAYSAGTAGTPGIASSTAMPAARAGGLGWVDKQHNFWLFGGTVSTSATSMTANDFWEYNTTSGQWTFWSGTIASSSSGSYGTMGTAALTNDPAARAYGSAWTDANGNLWMFGGTQIALNNNLNDLWVYTPTANEWTWVGGSQTQQASGMYGPQGTPTATAYPGARDAQLSWVDPSGNFWMFGGWNSEPFDYQTAQATPYYWDDLWEYATPAVKVAVTASPLSLTLRSVSGAPSASQTVTLTNSSASTITISSIAVPGANSADYVLSNGCGQMLTASASCTVGVVLDAATAGLLPATLVFTDSDASSPQNVVLNGFALTATTTVLSGTSNTVTTDASDTLTVAVKGTSGTGTPTGTVTLLNGNSTVAALTLNASGLATYTINQPPVGATTYTAQYNGDSNFGASTSGSFTVTSIAGPTTSAPAWAWLNGSSSAFTAPFSASSLASDPAGMGVASTGNYPGIRYDALTWADKSGNLYLFGGEELNDLWEYNTASAAWTFLKGSSSLASELDPSVYGTKGVAASTNLPGGRSDAMRWTDNSGNLWLFGGQGYDSNDQFGSLDDLWMYNPATNKWTWVGGDQTMAQAGIYGTKGVAASTNKPGGRYAAMTWVDSSGNFWLYGGVGYDSTGAQNYLADLWMYNVSTNQWTWVSGTNLGTFNLDIYGTQGVPAAGNLPSSRTGAMTWVDANGKLWMFGGTGYGISTSTSGDLNDLWKFDPTSAQWTYVGGTTTPYSNGSYGTLGTASTNDLPPARETGATFTDASGNFWMFGGAQLQFVTSGGTTTETVTPYNDLWMYSPTTNLWTWVAGSNTPSSAGTYGTKDASSTANIPAARLAVPAWTDNAGNFWLLGGTNTPQYSYPPVVYDDLWTATPAAQTGTPAVTLNPVNNLNFYTPVGSTSAAQTITVTNSGGGSLSVSVSLIGSDSGYFSESDNCSIPLAANASCTVSVTFTATGASGSFYSATVLVTDNAAGSPQNVGLLGYTESTSGAGVSISPSALSFSAKVGTPSTTQSVNVTSNGYASANVSGVSITGAGMADFSQTNNCSGSLGLQGICTITVTFTPAAAQNYSAAISIADNVSGSPQSVNLTGGGSATALATGTVVSTNSTTITVGTSITLKTVTLESNGASYPTGTVTFYDGTTALGTATLSGNYAGMTQLAVNSLTLGTHSITAVYGGDANNANSTSQPLMITVNASATASQWVWMDGPQGFQVAGSDIVYGTQGMPSTSNLPGTRFGTSSWTDASGNLWLFGGATSQNLQSYPSAYYNDLWKYAPTTGTWTWVTGSNAAAAGTVYGTYGSLGVAAAGSSPGGRDYAASWTDKSGNFWLFGGYGAGASTTQSGLGIGQLNDLWMFSPSTGLWTWEGGSNDPALGVEKDQPGIYGTQGVPSTSNIPGAREQAFFGTDSHGNFWLFGGEGGDSAGNYASLNDLWTFNPTTKAWTWVSGASVIPTAATNPGTGIAGVYGTKGTATSGNYPGSRGEGAAWLDSSGNFWLFGGSGLMATNYSGILDDLWMYNVSSGLWTWEGGNDTVSANDGFLGVYGTEGQASASSFPGSRFAPATWTDTAGNFWMFGGYGFASASPAGSLSDLWMYSPAASQWTWVDGSNLSGQNGSYGTQGVASASNIPGARQSTATWVDQSGNFWLYGGNLLGATADILPYADLWMYGSPVAQIAATPTLSVTPSSLTFSTTEGTTSAAQTVTLMNTGTVAVTLSAISLTGTNSTSFNQTNTCGASLAVNASCTASVTFSPATGGSFGATLSVANNATGSPQSVTLSGTVTSPTCVNNPATPYVNCNPGGSTVYTNTRTEQLTFATPTVTTATASAASTEIVAKYNGATVYNQTFAAAYGTPTVQAGITAANAAVTAAGGSGVSVSAPVLTSSSMNTSTASTFVYSVAQPQSSTTVLTDSQSVTNGPATIMAEAGADGNSANPLAGQLSQCTEGSLPSSTMPTCMATNGGTFQVNAGQADINDNVDSNYLINTATTTTTTTTTTAVYAITATATAPAVLLTPATLSFSSIIGTASAPQLATLMNTGNAVLTIGSISIPSGTGFADTTGCGTTLAAGANCTISVTYTPSSASATTTLSVTDNATGSPHSVMLTGVGTVAAAPVVSLTPASLSFSSTIGTASAPQLATLMNTGNAALTIGSITIPSGTGFADTTGCGTTLAAGANCTISVTYTPSSASATTTLSVTDNATGSPHSVMLTGVGTVAAAPVVSLTPASLSFSSVAGTASAAQSVTLKNTGSATLNITSVAIGGTNGSVFADSNGCGSTLAAGSSCAIAVTFTPASVASYAATLTITDSASGSPQSVTLTGAGTAAPSFLISSNPTTQTVQPGSAAVYGLTVSPQNGAFSNVVSLSVSGLPSGATATFSPATLTPGSSAATSTLTIQTTTSIVKAEPPLPGPGWKLGAPVLAILSLAMFPRRRYRHRLTLLLLALAALGASTALSGCGSAGFRLPSAGVTSFNITVNAVSGTEQQTTTVQLLVQ